MADRDHVDFQLRICLPQFQGQPLEIVLRLVRIVPAARVFLQPGRVEVILPLPRPAGVNVDLEIGTLLQGKVDEVLRHHDIAVLAVQVAVEGLKAENVPLEIGEGGGVVAEGRLLKSVLGMLPNPLQRRTRDHVPSPDLRVASTFGKFGQRRS